MKTSDFDYDLPRDLIAQHPLQKRDGSRLLVLIREQAAWLHAKMSDLPQYLHQGDSLILNDTKVIPARVFAKKATGGKVELFFLEECEHGVWKILLRASRRPRIGSVLRLNEDGGGSVSVTLLEDGDMGRALVRVDPADGFLAVLDTFGQTPLPPYISRLKPDREDKQRYQTIYARSPGAVAAPTAGLHFTPELFAALSQKGVHRAALTLHVGLGTFRPVTTEQVEHHRMEQERFELPQATVDGIKTAKATGKRCVAVGSTCVRTLEYAALEHGELRACCGRSDLFIYPPYTFKVVDAMLTNFHLPKSTLLMMICALAGHDLVMRAYEEAVRQKYRFFSYGDAMLIL